MFSTFAGIIGCGLSFGAAAFSDFATATIGLAGSTFAGAGLGDSSFAKAAFSSLCGLVTATVAGFSFATGLSLFAVMVSIWTLSVFCPGLWTSLFGVFSTFTKADSLFGGVAFSDTSAEGFSLEGATLSGFSFAPSGFAGSVFAIVFFEAAVGSLETAAFSTLMIGISASGCSFGLAAFSFFESALGVSAFATALLAGAFATLGVVTESAAACSGFPVTFFSAEIAFSFLSLASSALVISAFAIFFGSGFTTIGAFSAFVAGETADFSFDATALSGFKAGFSAASEVATDGCFTFKSAW